MEEMVRTKGKAGALGELPVEPVLARRSTVRYSKEYADSM